MRAGWLVGVALRVWLPRLCLLMRWRGPPYPLRQALTRGVLLGARGMHLCVLVGTSRQYDDAVVGHHLTPAIMCGHRLARVFTLPAWSFL